MNRLLTVIYEIVNEDVWSKVNPLHYNHNGLQAVTVRMGDAVSELGELQDARPAEPTSETCKWKYTFYGAELESPHNGCRYSSFQFDHCPTCGKKIEVVE